MPSPDFYRPAATKKKDRKIKLVILCIIFLIIAYIYFPHSLDGITGVKDVTAEDIAFVHVIAERRLA